MPDVFVPLDTTGYAPYYKAVTNRGLPIRFAQRYVDKHRNELTRYADWKALDVHLRQEKLLQRFDELVRTENPEMARLPRGAKADQMLEIQLRALIVRGMLDNAGYYPIIQELDNELQKALELVAQPKNLELQARK